MKSAYSVVDTRNAMEVIGGVYFSSYISGQMVSRKSHV
jgi:hypothetical protein